MMILLVWMVGHLRDDKEFHVVKGGNTYNKCIRVYTFTSKVHF